MFYRLVLIPGKSILIEVNQLQFVELNQIHFFYCINAELQNFLPLSLSIENCESISILIVRCVMLEL